eukprot:gene14256-15743_t
MPFERMKNNDMRFFVVTSATSVTAWNVGLIRVQISVPCQFVDDYTGAEMPIWAPPTPPNDGEDDLYVDPTLCFMYEQDTVPENHLPPTHFLKKNGMDLYAMKSNSKKTHYLGVFKRKRERISKAKSIFDKRALELLNRAKLKKSKMKQKGSVLPMQTSAHKPDYSQHGPEWQINEDWALLQAVNTLSELPLDPISETLHNKIPNWEMISEIVNATSIIRRSARQCRDRYLNVILPREEGKASSSHHHHHHHDYEQKSKKKKGLPMQMKAPMGHVPLKTQPLFSSDQGHKVMAVHQGKFELHKRASQKRKPPLRPVLSTDRSQKHPKHPVLQTRISPEEKVLTPLQLATLRADRIAKEKQLQVQAAATQQLQQQQPQQPQQPLASAQTADASKADVQKYRNLLATQTTQQQIQKAVALGVSQAGGTVLKGGLVLTSGTSVGQVTIAGNASMSSSLSTTAATFTGNKRARTLATVSLSQIPTNVTSTMKNTSRLLQTQTGQTTSAIATTKMVPQAVASSTGSGISTGQLARSSQVIGSAGTAQLVTGQQILPGKGLTPQHLALFQQKQAAQGQPTAQQVTVTATQLAGLTVQTMKGPVSVRGTAPQLTAGQLTVQQQQQILQQAFQKQMQKVQLGNPQMHQLISRQQSLSAQQKIQLQQISQQRQLQQQQIKFQQQQQRSANGSSPKQQLVMSQVNKPQTIPTQQLKHGSSSSPRPQVIQQQVQQNVTLPQSIAQSLPQQILLRSTVSQVNSQAQQIQVQQGIQLRATMVSQQTSQGLQQLRLSQPQQLQAMQAQVQIPSGTLVLQQQQQTQASQNLAQVIGSTPVQVVSSQPYQRTFQATLQQQPQIKQVTTLGQASNSQQLQQQQQQLQSQQIQQQQQPSQTVQLKVVTQPQLQQSQIQLQNQNQIAAGSTVTAQQLLQQQRQRMQTQQQQQSAKPAAEPVTVEEDTINLEQDDQQDRNQGASNAYALRRRSSSQKH